MQRDAKRAVVLPQLLMWASAEFLDDFPQIVDVLFDDPAGLL